MNTLQPLRMFGIIVCMVLAVLPAWLCFRSSHAPVGSAVDVLYAMLPFTVFVLTQLCLAEGRARERAERDRRDLSQRKRSEP